VAGCHTHVDRSHLTDKENTEEIKEIALSFREKRRNIRRSVMLVSNMLSENISIFNPDRSFPIQINIFQSSSLLALNKNEFIVVKGNAQWVGMVLSPQGNTCTSRW
jgi:hypothetical protein